MSPSTTPAFPTGRREQVWDFREIYAAHAAAVYRYALHQLGSSSEARDLTQEAFVVALRGMERFSGEKPIEGYLMGIVRNLALHWFRRNRTRTTFADQAWPNHDASPERPDSEAAETRRVLREMLDHFTPQERDFFVSHMMERPTRRSTAERFGVTPDQVRYRERKLRAKALAYLKRVGYLDEEARSSSSPGWESSAVAPAAVRA